jgi:adenylate cyclase class IV
MKAKNKEGVKSVYKGSTTNKTDVATLTLEIDPKRVSEVINLLRTNGFAKNLKVNLPQ